MLISRPSPGTRCWLPPASVPLYGRRQLLEAMPPFMFGGSMVEVVTMEKTTYAPPPARFEAGTQPVAQAVGMGAAADHLLAIGMDKIAAHEEKLTKRMLDGIAEYFRCACARAVDGGGPHRFGGIRCGRGASA